LCFVTVLAAGMGRFGRNLEAVTRLQRACRLALYRKIEATFEDIPGLYAGMRMPRNQHIRFYFRYDIIVT
jgi:hypothetical protein